MVRPLESIENLLFMLILDEIAGSQDRRDFSESFRNLLKIARIPRFSLASST